jgi:hypothetical protein
MPNPMLNISFKNNSDQRFIEALRSKPSRAIAVLQTKLNALLFQLSSYIVGQKLSAQVLHRRTGVLAGSVRAIPAHLEGTKLVGAVQAGGGPAFYGRVHEYGGPRAYQIIAVKARALAFLSHGKQVFAQSIMHPPAIQRAFMRPSLDENAGNIRAQLQAALDAELNKL